MSTWLAGRVVVSDPDPSPPIDFEIPLFDQWPTLKSIEGPLVNGCIAFTWEDGPEVTNDELVARTARIIKENEEQACSTS